ncbi:MAG: carbohydrate kinase family protein [Pseudomonadota bacterium]
MGAQADIICAGGAVINRKYRPQRRLISGTSNPANVQQTFGGVARNVAENLAMLGDSVGLISLVGADRAGDVLLANLADNGVDVSGVDRAAATPTAEYVAVFDEHGELSTGLAIMDIFDELDPERFANELKLARPSNWVFAECNLPVSCLNRLCELKAELGSLLAVDTVSISKAPRVAHLLNGIDLLFTNEAEARSVLQLDAAPEFLVEELAKAGAQSIVLTLGSRGALFSDKGAAGHVSAQAAAVADVSGAGDALIAGTLHGLMAGHDLRAALKVGNALAARTVESDLDVAPASAIEELAMALT